MKTHNFLLTSFLLTSLVLSACQLFPSPSNQTTTPESRNTGTPAGDSGDLYTLDLENCADFTAEDAAGILNVPVSQISTSIDPSTENVWGCFFTDDEALFNQVGFYIEPFTSSAEAAASVVQYREDLEFAFEYVPTSDETEAPYQDIDNVGDDAVYSDVNGALYAQKGNVVIQVIMPQTLEEKIEVAQTFFEKL